MIYCNIDVIFEFVWIKEVKVLYFEVLVDDYIVILFKVRICSLGKDNEYMYYFLLNWVYK